MKILTIDVTGANLIVAAYDGKNVAEKSSLNETKKHNSLVMPYIDFVLNELNLKIGDIDVFSCVVGPGSFTGIRIGIATIKALSFATKKPVVAIGALEAVAFNKNDEEFYVTIDALHNNCYAAKYNNCWKNEVLKTYTTYQDLDNLNVKYYKKEGDLKGKDLIDITLEKIKDNNYSTLEPLYLRKSQAERDLDGE